MYSFVDYCSSFCLLVIVLSVLLLFTGSDYLYGIFKLFKFRKSYFPQLFGHLFWVGAHGVQCQFSVISWRKVLLVGDTRLPGESHRPAAIHLKSLSYNSVSSTPRHDRDSNLQVVIGTDCIGGYESNYHTIPTMMAP